ncbi:MAG TPA: translation initiation factor IF-3 [Candidatus Saccharibacteria bacterium]|nr:translation initiation factor IF-3 [Candidatus Saccharibacteria bacterium]
MNGQIRAPQVRVIDADGNQLGVMTSREAYQLAQDQDLDLVEISPNANPPVCKIVDWGKYNYQKTKQAQKNRQSVKTFELKQMRFGLKIGDHDLGVKMRKVTSFLEAGHKVKITLFFRGRELAHKDIGFKLAERVIQSFGEQIAVDQQPQLAGKQLTFVIRGIPGKIGKPAEAEDTTDKPTTNVNE